ncbi:hypothetical protein [Compostibacter hankyongensis]|uniref:Beta-hexosaminidase bacterial type N-terminal domain-containing protein n=1 Tax=Compostibacter hankyongensis TaxID=1007089 RepID=A0ABP8FKV8_9BACT
MRREKLFFIVFMLLSLGDRPARAQESLPTGNHPEAIAFNYFPDKAYAVVWRNWNLVNPARIAKTLGCLEQTVGEMAAAMGLPPAIAVPPDFKKKAYITVIRRNWHLLPYSQLLTLLDMTEGDLAVALREDDFLFTKLGGLKPHCTPVHYTPPDHKTNERLRQMRRLVQHYFGKMRDQPAEQRFHFITELEGFRMPPGTVLTNQEGLRFIYSYFGVFGDPLVDTSLNPYPDGLLARLAGKGINGIWMHVVLNQLAPGGPDFPEYGKGAAQRLATLTNIVKRAAQYGIKVYLYMNEPRAMPAAFFKKRPDMAGVREGDLVTLCTSNPKVRDRITGSLAYVFRHVPGLGGVFTITGSENLTSCASHGGQAGCPRCSKRSYADIIAEVNTAIERGVHQGNPEAKVIIWDWGWNDRYAAEIIRKLPKSVWFMSVSEWAKTFERGGVRSAVGEYSISVAGPGPRAMSHWAMAKAAGLKTVAKVQLNNSWELSAVPWLPVMDLIAEHLSRLAAAHVDGQMLSWSLGGYPSPNLEIAQAFSVNPGADPGRVLDTLAAQRYGKDAAPWARKAWTAFSQAFRQFPYSAGGLYMGPQQVGPANLLFARPTGYHATMVGFPYDDLKSWRSNYPDTIFITQFDRVAEGWLSGLTYLDKAVKSSDRDKQQTAARDLFIARAAYLHFASVANQARFVMERDSLLGEPLPAAAKERLKKHLGRVLDREITFARELYGITRADARIGFEASNQYYYTPQDLVEKVLDCAYVREQLLGQHGGK